jgi:hypothetical protein
MPDDTEERTIKVRRVDFYPTEWLEGTVGLTHLERSVYITVCAAIYANGGPVEAGHARQLCPGRDFNKGLAGLVAKGKVTRDGNVIMQRRCAIECVKATRRIREARANGATGGRPINGLAKPNGSANKKANLQPTNHKKDSSSVGEVSARDRSQPGGVAPARDADAVAWRPIGSATPTPPNGQNDHDRRVQEHIEWLKASKPPSDLKLYLNAQMSDDPDHASRIFNLVDEMIAEEATW